MSDKFHVKNHFASFHKVGEELCGDNVRIKHNTEFFTMVLSDGIGSGVKANILSTLTSTIIAEMVNSHEPLASVIETVTSTLPECKERNSAYATFTIIKAYYNGLIEVVEFDNPSTIVLRDKKLLNIEKKEEFYNHRLVCEFSFNAKVDDFILCYSDGILHAGIDKRINLDWNQTAVENHLVKYYRTSDEPIEVSNILLQSVNELYNGECLDDCTVGVIKLCEAKESKVMVGPPKDKENDKFVVEELMKATHYKITCGGTTGQIVAKNLNTQIIHNTFDKNADVPPTSKILGIDLVCEGVITLSKADYLLTQCVKNKKFMEALLFGKEKDGGTLLAKYLLDSTKVSFLLGLAENEVHKTLSYSTISLDVKVNIIKNIINNLDKLGKIVEIKEY